MGAEAHERVHAGHTAGQRRVRRVVVVAACRVTETLGKRVGLNLELGDALVLVGCDGGELRLGEDEAAELLLLDIRDGAGLALPPLHQVHPRLELVHRVQDHLERDMLHEIQKTNPK
mgnify:FL=1